MDLTNLGSALPPAAQAEFARLVAALEHSQRTHRILDFYPDAGPLRRELYPKHMEFFEAGAKYRERCFMAANRIGKCSTISSQIETPDGPATVGELFMRGGRFRVFAWNGAHKVERWAGPVFRKDEPEPCVRVTMSDGRWFEAALGHRLLTAGGWLRVGDYVQLSRLQGGLPPSPLLSSWGFGPSIHDADDPRSTGTSRGFPAGYPEGRRSCGGQPLPEVAACLSPAASQVDAPPRSALGAHQGLRRRCTDSLSVSGFRASILGAVRRLAARCAALKARAADTIGRSLIANSQAIRQPLVAFFAQPRSALEADRGQSWALAVFAYGCDGASRSAPVRHTSHRESQRRPTGSSAALGSEIELGARPLPLPLVDGNRIVRVSFIGVHDVYDWPVDDLHNYCAAGLVHHNSEGAGGYETTLHLTGEYPAWWPGRRFDRATMGYACGKTNETTRDIVQTKLFGKVRMEGQRKVFTGTGLVPARCIGDVTWKQGVADLADTVRVRHSSGDWSEVNLKSYAQGRGSFEGTERDWIWLDEEPPVDIYGECLIRTATTRGIVYITFTPLEGATDVVQSFMPPKMMNEIMEQFRNAGN